MKQIPLTPFLKKTACIAFAALTLHLYADTTIVYIKPGGTGDGSSWANATGDIGAAVTRVQTDTSLLPAEIRLAQGIYYPTDTITISNGVTILGGWPGIDENETRDIDTFRSVVSGDIERNDTWQRFDFVNNKEDTTDAGAIIQDGSLNIPELLGSYDSIAPKNGTCKDNLWRVFTIAQNADTSCGLDGIWITGGGRGTMANATTELEIRLDYGGAVCVAQSAAPIMRDLRIVGNYAQYGIVYYHNNTIRHATIEGCRFMFNRLANRGSLLTRASDITIDNCTFIGNIRNAASSGSPSIYLWTGARPVITNCWFERNYVTAGQYSPASGISAEGASYIKITDCVFTNNYASGQYAKGASSAIGIENAKQTRVTNCRFVDNYSKVLNNGATTDSFSPGVISITTVENFIENCVFKANTVEAIHTRPGRCTTIGPVMVGTSSQYPVSATFLNCSFYDNRSITTNTPADTTFKKSSAITIYVASPTPVVQTGIAHCSFFGSTSTDDPDIIWTGYEDNSPTNTIINSIFWNNGTAAYTPLSSSAEGKFAVKNCIMKGQSLADSTTASEISRDDPLLQILPEIGHLIPGARVPDIRKTLNVFQYENSQHVKYLCFVDDSATNKLILSSSEPSTLSVTSDALGLTRPLGAATHGAVQTLTDAAENGKTLTCRVVPAIAGILSGPAVQTVAPGTALLPVTVTESDTNVFSFIGWKREDGTMYCTDATIELQTLTEDTLLCAIFETKDLTWTFDLGAHGTFEENGLPTISKTVQPGSAAPAVPAYNIDTEWFFSGWDQNIPTIVGTNSLTFTAQYFEKLHRIIRVDTNLKNSLNDGQTWASAMTNIQEAIDIAGLWTGEVWLKTGLHHHGKTKEDTLLMRNNVTIYGGFQGVEGETLTSRDPRRWPSIISGDLNDDDCWCTPSGSEILRDGNRVSIFNADLKINCKSADDPDMYWTPGNITDNAGSIFKNVTELNDTAVLDGLVLASTTSSAMLNEFKAHPRVTNCVFTATTGDQGSAISMQSWMKIEDCDFIGNNTRQGTVFIASLGPWSSPAEIRDCRFKDNVTITARGALAAQGGKCIVENTIFEGNVSTSFNFGPGSAIGAENATMRIFNCTFSGNVATNCPSIVHVGGQGDSQFSRIVSNCFFSANRVINSKDGCCILSAGATDLKVLNSAFVSNEVSCVDTANSGTRISCITQASSHRYLFGNCTFAGNRCSTKDTNTSAQRVASTIVCNNQGFAGVVNCTFLDNDCKNGDLACVNTVYPINLFNVIMWNSSTAYVPIVSVGTINDGSGINVRNSTIKNFSDNNLITLTNSVSTSSPMLKNKFECFGTLFGYLLLGTSPARNTGCDIWVNATGEWIFNIEAQGVTPKYRMCTSSTSSGGNPVAPINDVFGVMRPLGEFAQGAVQTYAKIALRIILL